MMIYIDASKRSKNGGLAQLVERLLCMQKVTGSIPVTSISLLLHTAVAKF